MIPKTIHRRHILGAIARVETHGVPRSRQSTRYLLMYGGKPFPPKYIVALAAELATGELLSSSKFGGGAETNGFLAALGFETIAKPEQQQPKWHEGSAASLHTAASDAAVKAPGLEPMKLTHDQRCSDCKNAIIDMLRRVYGPYGVVKCEHRLQLPLRLEDMPLGQTTDMLAEVHEMLATMRGHQDFVRSRTTRPCDVFVTEPGFMVELDESQHFTSARAAALKRLPNQMELGFDRDRWISLCESINAADPSPVDRDEQRAWYDLVRDVAHLQDQVAAVTVRIALGFNEWCALNANSDDDVERFKSWVPSLPPPPKPAIEPTTTASVATLSDVSSVEGRTMTDPNRALRVCRVVPDLCASKSELAGWGSGTDRPAWNGFFSATRASFEADPAARVMRFARIASLASAGGAGVLALPACSLMLSPEAPIEHWGDALADVPHVIAGAFSSQRGEFIAHFERGELVEEIDAYPPWLMQVGSTQVMTTISSTIQCVYEGDFGMSVARPPVEGSPIIVLDLGHNQYNGRYGKTLRKVCRVLEATLVAPTVFLLGYWHYRSGSRYYNWVEPRASSWIGSSTRHSPDAVSGADDWLDFVDIDSAAMITGFEKRPAALRSGPTAAKANRDAGPPPRMVLQNAVLKLVDAPPRGFPLRKPPWQYKWECIVLETKHTKAGDVALDIFFGGGTPDVTARVQIRGSKERPSRIRATTERASEIQQRLAGEFGRCDVSADAEGKTNYVVPRTAGLRSGQWDAGAIARCADKIAGAFGELMPFIS